MDNTTVLIADGNEDFREELKRLLAGTFSVLCARDGDRALEILRMKTPDILVLDPVLPRLDGISLLRVAAQEEIRPVVVLESVFFSPYLQRIAPELGVEYMVQKPCNMTMLAARIAELSVLRRERAPDVREQLGRALIKAGLSVKYVGFPYVVESLLIMREQGDVALTKVVYPTVAKRLGCGVTGVEHGIRNAVEAAWDSRNPLLCETLFPGLSCRPSNGTFLKRMYLYLQSESDCMFP